MQHIVVIGIKVVGSMVAGMLIGAIVDRIVAGDSLL